MQNSRTASENDSIQSAVCFLPSSLPPPPPPPPPPPSKLNPPIQNCGCKHATTKELKMLKKSPVEEVTSALRHITFNFYVENPSILISLYHPILPVIQEGRCCGIVALSMASQLIHEVSASDILSVAKSWKFTKEGEMFSAVNMSVLASSLLSCDAVVIDNLDAHKNDLLKHICDGWPVLIPYDADRNHFPCSNNGTTAHWAVISGLCFALSDKNAMSTLKSYEMIQEYPELNVYIAKDGDSVKKLLKFSDRVFLFAHQGKSKHLAAWDLNDLLESNKNMYEVTKKYRSDELILPEGDSLSGLRNKAVLLKKRE